MYRILSHRYSFLFVIIGLMISGLASAHGVSWEEIKGDDAIYGANFTYDDGSLMPFAEVKILSPEGKTYQNGRTDRHGNFVFLPNVSGEWSISANDGVGHLAEAKLIVKEKGDHAVEDISLLSSQSKSDNRLLKIILVTSVLINFAVIMTIIRDRREKREDLKIIDNV